MRGGRKERDERSQFRSFASDLLRDGGSRSAPSEQHWHSPARSPSPRLDDAPLPPAGRSSSASRASPLDVDQPPAIPSSATPATSRLLLDSTTSRCDSPPTAPSASSPPRRSRSVAPRAILLRRRSSSTGSRFFPKAVLRTSGTGERSAAAPCQVGRAAAPTLRAAAYSCVGGRLRLLWEQGEVQQTRVLHVSALRNYQRRQVSRRAARCARSESVRGLVAQLTNSSRCSQRSRSL